MKKKTLILAGALLAISTGAQAAEQAELVVTGQIIPSACSITLSNNGSADFGEIQARDLNEDTPTKLDTKVLYLTVNCQSDTQFALSAVDDKAASVVEEAVAVALASASTEDAYGLGSSNGKGIGAYVIELGRAQADSKTTTMISSANGSGSWNSASMLKPGETLRTSWKSDDEDVSAMRLAQVQLNVRAALAAASELDLSNGITLEGKAGIELHYL